VEMEGGELKEGKGMEGTRRKGRVTTCCPISNELSPPMPFRGSNSARPKGFEEALLSPLS